MQDEHSSQSEHSQGQMQPQLGQVSFSLEIKVFVSNIFGLVVIIIMNFIINNIAYKINPGNDLNIFKNLIITIF